MKITVKGIFQDEKTQPNKRREQPTSLTPLAWYAIYHGNGGYAREQAEAAKVFEEMKQYRIEHGSMSQTSTRLKLEGVAGEWNSALFHFDPRCPLIAIPYENPSHTYSGICEFSKK